MKRRINERELGMLTVLLEDCGYVNVARKINLDNASYNGATFFEASDSPDGKIFTYVEDDVVDEKGNPYIFDYPYFQNFGEMEKGRRLIALYIEDSYMLLPINGDTFMLVGASSDREFNVDKRKSVKLPTPLVLALPKEPEREIISSDIEAIRGTVIKNGKFTAASIVGSIALSLLFFIIIGVSYIFVVSSVVDNDSKNLFIGITAAAILLFIAGIVFSIKFFRNIYLRNVMKMKYIKQVMIVGTKKERIKGGVVNVGIYEWVGNDIRYSNYTVGFAQLFLNEEVHYGDMVYMLSKKKDTEMDILTSRIFVAKNYHN